MIQAQLQLKIETQPEDELRSTSIFLDNLKVNAVVWLAYEVS